MPELPEVETVCRGLNQVTLGKTIIGGEVYLERSLVYGGLVSEFWEKISGLHFLNWYRRGKYLLADLGDSKGQKKAGLGVHLRMTGQLLWVTPDTPLPKHTRLRFFCDTHKELRFVDIRTFGKIWWVEDSPEKTISGLAKLGLDPFSPDFSTDFLKNAFKTCQRPLKTALLDQTIVAGLGNIYADEALFKSQILPTAIAAHLNLEQWDNLRKAILEVLTLAIEQGGTTFSDFQGVTGINGNYGGMAWVYGRKAQPCRICGTLIERIKLGGRSSHFCPHCQH